MTTLSPTETLEGHINQNGIRPGPQKLAQFKRALTLRGTPALYAQEGKGSFYLFHRHRTYNESEGIWMGWERKRGKLLDFNKLLLGGEDHFPVKAGNLRLLSEVKYVITLDLDTQLPRDAARRLVGAMAHPLNRAVIDASTNTVIDGYGILQPRVDISIQSANRSRFAAIFSSDAGFDVYSRAVSDVYQDLTGEGSYHGERHLRPGDVPPAAGPPFPRRAAAQP